MARSTSPDLEDASKTVQDLIQLMKSNDGDVETEINNRHGGVLGIARQLQTSTKKGMIATSGSLDERTKRFGSNRQDDYRLPKSYFKQLLHSLTDPVLIVLIVGAIVSVVLGIYYPETCHGRSIVNQKKIAWMEGVGILGTLCIIILLSSISDILRNNSWQNLQDKIEEQRKATVIRGGKKEFICFRDIKVGDLCEITTGSIIPADGILVEITEIVTDESALGRDRRIIKTQKNPFVFSSSHVIVGNGKMIVLALGGKTQAGERNRKDKYQHVEQEMSAIRQSLQGKLTRASAILGLLGIIVGVIVALVLLISFFVKVYSIENLPYDPSHWNEIIKAIIIGIVIIIVAEPEGLSMAVTITLSRSLGFMQRRGIFIRNIDALETMGNVTTMCCNKTGVLTTVSSLAMTEEVAESYIDGQYFRGSARDFRAKISENVVDELANCIAINTSYSSNIQFSDTDDTFMVVGDISECALLAFSDSLDTSYRLIRRANPADGFIKVFPFDPDKKFMTTVVAADKESYKIYSKGAQEVMLDRCTSILTNEGQQVLDVPTRERITTVIDKMQHKSQLKVMCIASRTISQPNEMTAWESEDVDKDLTLVAIVGIESTVGEKSVGSRMVVAEGRLISKKTFGDGHFTLANYKRIVNHTLVEDFCRSVAVNTNYLSDIQNEGPDMLPQQVGSPLDCALLQFVLELGSTYQHHRDQFPHENHVEYRSFASDAPNEQYTATVIKIDPNTYRVYVKGGINYILARCSRIIQNHPDEKLDLDDSTKNNIYNIVKALEQKAMIPIAFAIKDIAVTGNGPPDWSKKDSVLSDLMFVGYVGLKETTRGEASDAILTCQRAGINVTMVTGSSLQSAGTFAKKCGILMPSEKWPSKEKQVFGYNWPTLKTETAGDSARTQIDQSKFDSVWPDQLRVLANCPPASKQAFVSGIRGSKAFRENGEIIAVVACGIHDGPFMKEGDVALSMGVSGSNVAQEAADIILKTDKFSSVLETITWGRHIYETVLKFLQFQLTATWVTLILMTVCAIVFQRSLFSAAQLLWLNLIMDALASVAMSGEEPSAEVLRHKPYGRDKPLVSRAILRNVIGHSIFQLTITFLLIFAFPHFIDVRDGYGKTSICRPSQHSTMVFTTLIFMQLFNEINCRRVQDRNVFYSKGVAFDWKFWIIWLLSFGLQIIIVFFFDNAFRVRPMDAQQWLWCLFFGFSELVWGQIIFTIPKKWIPSALLCCTMGVPSRGKGCCLCLRSSRSRDQVDGPREFYGIGSHSHHNSRSTVRVGPVA